MYWSGAADKEVFRAGAVRELRQCQLGAETLWEFLQLQKVSLPKVVIFPRAAHTPHLMTGWYWRCGVNSHPNSAKSCSSRAPHGTRWGLSCLQHSPVSPGAPSTQPCVFHSAAGNDPNFLHANLQICFCRVFPREPGFQTLISLTSSNTHHNRQMGSAARERRYEEAYLYIGSGNIPLVHSLDSLYCSSRLKWVEILEILILENVICCNQSPPGKAYHRYFHFNCKKWSRSLDTNRDLINNLIT